jgi:hypothetical protein
VRKHESARSHPPLSLQSTHQKPKSQAFALLFFALSLLLIRRENGGKAKRACDFFLLTKANPHRVFLLLPLLQNHAGRSLLSFHYDRVFFLPPLSSKPRGSPAPFSLFFNYSGFLPSAPFFKTTRFLPAFFTLFQLFGFSIVCPFFENHAVLPCHFFTSLASLSARVFPHNVLPKRKEVSPKMRSASGSVVRATVLGRPARSPGVSGARRGLSLRVCAASGRRTRFELW